MAGQAPRSPESDPDEREAEAGPRPLDETQNRRQAGQADHDVESRKPRVDVRVARPERSSARGEEEPESVEGIAPGLDDEQPRRQPQQVRSRARRDVEPARRQSGAP